MQVENRFKIGSITKTFVATAVLELVRDGTLRLDDTVAHWLPGLVPNTHITVKQLLRHQSGLFDYFEDARATEPYLAGDLGYVWAPRALIKLAASHPPNFPPGTAFSYSNTNYLVLGLIVERATGRSLRQELRRRIFRPLHLSSTRFPTSQRFGPRLAHGYLWSAQDRQDVTAVRQSLAWAAGGVVSAPATSPGSPARCSADAFSRSTCFTRCVTPFRSGRASDTAWAASASHRRAGRCGGMTDRSPDTCRTRSPPPAVAIRWCSPAAQKAAARLIRTAACARL